MKTNGNGKYMTGDDAIARNRRIYIMKHFCGMNSLAIAPHCKLTPSRVRQILDACDEKLYIVDFAQFQDSLQKSLSACSVVVGTP